MKVPFYSSTREYVNQKVEFDKAVADVIENGNFILGEDVTKLEEEIAEYSHVPYAVGVANGSDALVIASDILGYKEGAEVLTPVFTFFASTSCLARLGAKPVFTDVDPETFCMDMNDAGNRIGPKTKGIIPVHLFLQTADMNSCLRLAKENNLSVLEDAAEAFGMGTQINGKIKTAGTLGDFGVYSFFPTKTLGGYGDGGMIITSNEEYYLKAKSLRVHGSSVKYYHDFIGYNSRLDTLQAAVLRIKLKRIDKGIARRKELAGMYYEQLSRLAQVEMPRVKQGNKPVYYVFCIKAEDRNNLNAYLNENGIGTSIYYPVPLHLQKCFQYLGYKKGDFPVAESICQSVLALPMYPELTEEEVSYTCDKIKEFYIK